MSKRTSIFSLLALMLAVASMSGSASASSGADFALANSEDFGPIVNVKVPDGEGILMVFAVEQKANGFELLNLQASTTPTDSDPRLIMQNNGSEAMITRDRLSGSGRIYAVMKYENGDILQSSVPYSASPEVVLGETKKASLSAGNIADPLIYLTEKQGDLEVTTNADGKNKCIVCFALETRVYKEPNSLSALLDEGSAGPEDFVERKETKLIQMQDGRWSNPYGIFRENTEDKATVKGNIFLEGTELGTERTLYVFLIEGDGKTEIDAVGFTSAMNAEGKEVMSYNEEAKMASVI